MPVNPRVVLLIDPTDGVESVTGHASNIDSNLNIEVVHSPEEFDEAIKGLPFAYRFEKPGIQELIQS